MIQQTVKPKTQQDLQAIVKPDTRRIDAHFHMHYSFSPIQIYSDVRTPVDQDVLDGYDKVRREFKEMFNLQRLVAVLAPHFEGANTTLLQDDFLYPGIYIHIEDNYEPILDKAEGYQFVQLDTLNGETELISHPLDKPSKLEEIVDYASKKGIRKFQLHTHGLDHRHLRGLRNLMKGDRLFYLVSGVESIYWSREYWKSEIKPKDILDLQGQLLLGTADTGTMIEIPHKYLRQAVEDGLEDMICFESNFILNSLHNKAPSWFYSGSIERVEGAIGYNAKISEGNAEQFMK